MSATPVFAKYVRVGDLVWHSIAKTWLPLVSVQVQNDRLGGWVKHESGKGERGWAPNVAADGLVFVRRTN